MKTIYFLIAISLPMFYACVAGKASASNKNGFNKNKVIAHRGAWKLSGTPQNSMASFEEALKLGCEGTEFDIRMTADNILILNHDADHQGMDIEKSTYLALKEKPLKNGETLPLLEDIIKRGLQQKQTRLVAEIKPSPAGKQRSILMAEKTWELFQRYQAGDQVVYISFDYDILKRIKELQPTAEVQYLNGEKSPAELKADGMDADYHFNIIRKDSNWIAKAHEAGILVNSWTVNDSTLMKEFLRKGIDMITTDEPELLLQIVSRKNE